MKYKIVPFRQLDDRQVAEVAKLHHAVLHSLLAELGLPFVERYYKIAQMDNTVTGFCALSEHGAPLGWVIGSSKPEQVNGRLREPLMWFIPQLARALLKRPGLLWQLIVSSRSASLDLKEDRIELVYIGVAPSVRGQGLGKALLDAFVRACTGEYHSVSLSVEEENTEAIRLYTKAGFKIMETIVEGRFKRLRMELHLV